MGKTKLSLGNKHERGGHLCDGGQDELKSASVHLVQVYTN